MTKGWVDSEINNTKQRLEDAGKYKFLTFADGDSKELNFTLEQPKKRLNKWNNEVADFVVEYEGQKYRYTVNTNSSQYLKILYNLQSGKTKMVIKRTGKDKSDTKYDVL